jgi:hypothetical protein
MKTILSVMVVACLLVSSALARQWTSRSGGFAVEAELVDVKDGNAILKKADGTQISVPLAKLSLGDVRYINDVLKAAEAAVAGGKPEVPAERPKGDSAPGPAPAAAPAGLQYQWKDGQTYVYHVKIVGDRGDYNEELAGDVTYKVKSVAEDEIQLLMTSDLSGKHGTAPVRIVVLPGRRVRFYSEVEGPKSVTISVDPLGRVSRIEGSAPLPFLLGDLSQLMFEQLSPEKKGTWTIGADTAVSVIVTHFPFFRYSPIGLHEGVPANEKTVYAVQGQTDKAVLLSKHYELVTAATIGGKPRFEVTGDGKLTFSLERRVFSHLDLKMQVTVRDANKTEEIPLQVTYRLLSDADLAKAAQAAAEAKRKAEEEQHEKARPLTAAEIETAAADLASGEKPRVDRALKLLAEKKPQQPAPKVAKALEPLLLQGENVSVRSAAAQAMKNWATAESVPALLKAIHDDWPPVRAISIEAMVPFKPTEAIKPVAQQLLDMQTRGAAVKFLKAIGSQAEDPVLAILENSKDPWVRSEACNLLGSIGTKKSLGALEKTVSDENWMVNGAARKAVAAVKARE